MIIRIFLLSAFLLAVRSRTLDGTRKGISGRSESHEHEGGHSSGNVDLTECTDCYDQKKEIQEEKPIDFESTTKTGHKSTTRWLNTTPDLKETRKVSRRYRKNRKSHGKTQKISQPFLSISGVKVTISKGGSKRRKTSQRNTDIKKNANSRDKDLSTGNIHLTGSSNSDIENDVIRKGKQNHQIEYGTSARQKNKEVANGEVYLGDNPSNIQIKPLGKITDSSEAKAEEKPNSHHEENHQSPRKISHGQKNGASKIMKGYSHELIEHHRKEEEKVKGNERENRPEDKKLEKIELQEQNTSRKLTEQSERNDNKKIDRKIDGKTVTVNKEEIHAISNVVNKRRGRKGKVKSRRGRKKQVARGPKDLSKMTVPSDIVQDDRWSRPGLIQVPDVERLERRLHPKVEAPIDDIIMSLMKMLQMIQHSVFLVDYNYKHSFNVTRWDIMVGVREELMNIAKENDKVYLAVMDIALHTKGLYLRAHQGHRYGNPQAVSSLPVMQRIRLTNMDLRAKYQYARDELKAAEMLQRKISGLKRQRRNLRYDYTELTRKIAEKLPSRALYDLARQANQTIQVLVYSRAMKDAMDRRHFSHRTGNSTYLNMQIARNYINDARDILADVKKEYSNNEEKAKQILRAQQLRSTEETHGFDLSHMERWATVDKAKYHTDELFKSAAMILMIFKPILKEASDIIAAVRNGTHESKVERTVRNIRDKVKMLNATMFSIRSVVCTDQYEVCIARKPVPEVKEIEKEETLDRATSEDDDMFIEMSSGDEIDISSGDGSDLPVDTSVEVDLAKSSKESLTDKNQNSSSVSVNKTKVILPDTDDEDMLEESTKTKKVKSTAATKTKSPAITTMTTPSDKTTPAPVESEEDDNGGWFWDDPFGFLQDQFYDSNTRHKRDVENEISSNITLSELIQKHLKNRSDVNEDIASKAKLRLKSVNELQDLVNKLTAQINRFENKTIAMRNFVLKWRANVAEFKAVHDRVLDVSKNIKTKQEAFAEQSAKSVKKAKAKLKRMEELYEKNKDRVNDDTGPETAQNAIELALKVKDNIGQIVALKQLNPTPCKKLQDMDSMIRANISQLRQKIKQAKLIASSLNVAVSMEGSNHLKIPLQNTDNGKQSRMQMDMMVKSKSDSGAIAVLQTNNTGTVVISMEDFIPKLGIFDEGGYEIEENSGDSPLMNNTWYRFSFERFATIYNLTVYNGTSLIQSFITRVEEDDYPTVYHPPSSLFIGGATDKYDLETWSGCIGDVKVNGEYLNMLTADSNETVPKSCTLLSNTMGEERSLVLDGSSHTLYKLRPQQQRLRISTFTINVTVQSDGSIFTVNAENNRFKAMANVKERRLLVTVQHHRLRSDLISVIDVIGIKLNLEIMTNGRTIDILLNGRKDVLNKTTDRIETSKVKSGEIHLGSSSNETRSIRGCVHGIHMNNEDVPLNSMTEAVNVAYGTCQEDHCVTFTFKSQPIKFFNVTDGDYLLFVFKYGSMGGVLQYSKGEKFNLNILIDNEGLDMVETVKDNSESLELSETYFKEGDDVVVMVTDKDKVVTVMVGEEERTFSYGSRGGFFGLFGGGGDEDEDVPYSISIGSTEESDVTFFGNLVMFHINNTKIDLTQYLSTNNIQRCALQRQEPVAVPLLVKRKQLVC